jgi:large subunit ribosomal protein L21
MYAIVKTGGKQYRVEPGQKLLIERLAAVEGADVKLEPILYRSDDAVFDKAGLERVQVTAKVLAHVRGEKLRVFKFKPKRGYKRRTGHRQDLTQIEVTDISHGKAKAPADKAAAKAPAAKAPSEKAPGEKAPGGKAADAGAGKPAAKAKASTGRAAGTKPATGKAAAAKPAAKPKAAPKAKPAAQEKPAKAKAQASKPKEEPSDGS